MGRLEGKVALVTGAARGQGRAHAVRLAEEGADIIALDIRTQIESVPYSLASEDELADTARLVEQIGRRVVTAHADVRRRDELSAASKLGVETLGRLDIVVANAGIWSSAPFLELSDEMYHDMIDVQLHGPYYTCKATVPYLLENESGGSIILINSIAGLVAFPNQLHYNVAKHGGVGLMRSLANELAERLIRVNSIHPGATFTQMVNQQNLWSEVAPQVDDPTVQDFATRFQTLNLLPVPWADPVDIANAVVWLASDEARYVTGICLPVDAGFLAKAR